MGGRTGGIGWPLARRRPDHLAARPGRQPPHPTDQHPPDRGGEDPMSQIELRALLSQAGEILFIRARGSSASWGLPGGTLSDDADDADAAMGSFLSEYGVA